MKQSYQKHLPRKFFRDSTENVARALLGKLIVRSDALGRRLSGIVVEAEAYLAENDPASHSHRGPGKKNASMFLPPGTLYVYPIHSRYCLNVVTESRGVGAAVLIRALEPWEGLPYMAKHRGLPEWGNASRMTVGRSRLTHFGWAHRLTSGPGRLCQALGIDRDLDGLDLLAREMVWLEPTPTDASCESRIRCSPRIGISQARDLPLRWFLDGNRFVSGRAAEHSAGRYWTYRDWDSS